MPRWLKWLLAFCVAFPITPLIIFAGVAFFPNPTEPAIAAPPAPSLASSAIKITTATGHGSGVHIGNGFVLTAAHVVKDVAITGAKDDSGGEHKVEVLWINADYDLALLKVEGAASLTVSHLTCETVPTGADIFTTGNPLSLEFVTSYGRVASKPASFPPWRSAFIADLNAIPGQSGSGVLDKDGRVVGILVGVAVAPTSQFSASFTHFGFVVPSITVCKLMGRNV